ncbi:hypothetical protein EJV44_04690 [Ancylobacter aquaticus]|nr:hypothetical protein EJV44_04690 [Ancylobacter aquaticus]
MSDGVTLADLRGLPPARAIEEYSHSAIVNEMIASYRARWDALRVQYPDLPTFDTLELESDTTRKSFQEVAYREVLLRARINDAIRANLLFYARGTDLDHLAVFHDVLRLLSEEDEALASRTILAIAGRSPGGPKERYEAIARGADVRARHVHAYRIGRDPTIHVAVWSTDNAGLADEALLANVRAALADPAHGLINDTFNVRAAVFKVVDVTLDVWLLPDAMESILDTIPATVASAWASETGMGRDLVAEWVQARAMIAGVQRARMTSAEVVAAPYEAVSIRSVTPAMRGRAF